MMQHWIIDDQARELIDNWRLGLPDAKLLSPTEARKLPFDQSGIYWFGTRESGLMKYDPVNKPFQYLSHDADNPKSMSAGGKRGI